MPRNADNFFTNDNDIGLIGRGDSIENCFVNIANVMFSLTADVKNIHPIQILTFEFEEADLKQALLTWLNFLISKSREHKLLFGDCRLRREENLWKATVSGEPIREALFTSMQIKNASPSHITVEKVDHEWEARCLVEVKLGETNKLDDNASP